MQLQRKHMVQTVLQSHTSVVGIKGRVESKRRGERGGGRETGMDNGYTPCYGKDAGRHETLSLHYTNSVVYLYSPTNEKNSHIRAS
jgi:hypothetical protein